MGFADCFREGVLISLFFALDYRRRIRGFRGPHGERRAEQRHAGSARLAEDLHQLSGFRRDKTRRAVLDLGVFDRERIDALDGVESVPAGGLIGVGGRVTGLVAAPV